MRQPEFLIKISGPLIADPGRSLYLDLTVQLLKSETALGPFRPGRA